MKYLKQAAVVVGVLLVVGCTARPDESAVAKFGSAVESTSASLSTALDAAMQAERMWLDQQYAVSLLRLDRGSATSGIEVDEPQITPAMVQARKKVFSALALYAQSLQKLTGDDTLTPVREQLDAAGQGILAINMSAAQFGFGGQSEDGAIEKAIQTAITEFGEALVEAKLNREVPKIIEDVHPALMELVEVVNDDFGLSELPGLRDVVADSRKNIVTLTKSSIALIYADEETGKSAVYDLVLSSRTKFRDLEKLDQAFDPISPALQRMLKAHDSLRSPDSSETWARVNIFVEHAQDLRERFGRVAAAFGE